MPEQVGQLSTGRCAGLHPRFKDTQPADTERTDRYRAEGEDTDSHCSQRECPGADCKNSDGTSFDFLALLQLLHNPGENIRGESQQLLESTPASLSFGGSDNQTC